MDHLVNSRSIRKNWKRVVGCQSRKIQKSNPVSVKNFSELSFKIWHMYIWSTFPILIAVRTDSFVTMMGYVHKLQILEGFPGT